MRALVTGAASGIGRAVCLLLAEAGDASIAAVDLDRDRLEALVAELGDAGAEAVPFAGDLASPEFVRRATGEATERLGGLDALVSNAGIVGAERLAEVTVEGWDRMFAVNLRATWLLAQAARPALAASRGSIVATTSISGSQPTAGIGAYSTTKAGLIMLVQQLANEWGPEGIRVNCVSPGAVHTPMSDPLYADREAKDQRARAIPLRRVADADDVAAVVGFLLGDAARYVTGEEILVDGGLHTILMGGLRGD